MELAITRPDDFHHHFRDDARLGIATRCIAKTYARAVAMPNLAPPICTTDQALAYRKRILEVCPPGSDFEPLMSLYLTEKMTKEEIYTAKASGKIVGVKLYPKGATTNSAAGIATITRALPIFKAMAEVGLVLQIHGETTDPNVDIFDREADFIERVLRPLVQELPKLKIVLEHITTKEAVDFILASSANLAATITPQHLLYNRNALFNGGLRPHFYCLPVLKRRLHQEALIKAIQSGSKKFFLGTDSAPHFKNEKEKDCGCAGVFSAPASLELYAEAFEDAGALEHFEAFCSFHGADFYGLPRNRGQIRLVRRSWRMAESFDVDGQKLIPMRAGMEVRWQVFSPTM